VRTAFDVNARYCVLRFTVVLDARRRVFEICGLILHEDDNAENGA
jgi:hypothetical protein